MLKTQNLIKQHQMLARSITHGLRQDGLSHEAVYVPAIDPSVDPDIEFHLAGARSQVSLQLDMFGGAVLNRFSYKDGEMESMQEIKSFERVKLFDIIEAVVLELRARVGAA